MAVRESGARYQRAAAVRLRSVRPCSRCRQSNGKGNACTSRGRARPAFKWLGSAGVVRQEYGGPSPAAAPALSPPRRAVGASGRGSRSPARAVPPPRAAPPALRRPRRRAEEEVWEETEWILTPNGCEELCLLRLVLPGSAFPNALFAFASFVFSRGHTFLFGSHPRRDELGWQGLAENVAG